MYEQYKTRIPELMHERGWTKAELGRRMGITEAGVTRIIQGDGVPLSMMERAATALGVQVWELLATRQQVIMSASSVRHDVLCPKCGRRIGLHIGVACEAMHPSKRFDDNDPAASIQ